MSDSADMTDAKLAPLLEHFGERLNRVFAYFICALEFEGDEDLRADPTHNARAWTLQTIENACIDTSLIALRDLDDFLTPRAGRTKPDDIRASDFSYAGSHTFLTQSERERINKLIAHTTTVGATAQGFRWDILELATKGVSQSLEFLKWVENEYGLVHFYLYTAALVIRTRVQSQFAFITHEAKKRRATKSKDGPSS
jgi:hypothetical protein